MCCWTVMRYGALIGLSRRNRLKFLDVLLTRRTQDRRQTGTPDLRGHNLRGQRDARKQPGEFTGRVGVKAALLLQDVLLDGHEVRGAHSSLPTESAYVSWGSSGVHF